MPGTQLITSHIFFIYPQATRYGFTVPVLQMRKLSVREINDIQGYTAHEW